MNKKLYINTCTESKTVSYILDDRKIALAEISKLPDDTWYFNRIFVPVEYRGQGIATDLMKELIKLADESKITICCDINPYGDLNFDQLKVFYKKFGFVEDDFFHLKRGN